MTKTLRLACAYGAFFAIACAHASKDATAEPVVSLERFRDCLACSAYRIDLYANGRIVYEGYDFVKVTGRQLGQTSPDKVALVVDAVRDMGFMTLKDHFIEQSRPVQGKTRITVSLDGQTKSTVFAYSRAEVNVRLISLARLIDEVTAAKQWVCPVRLGERESCGLD